MELVSQKKQKRRDTKQRVKAFTFLSNNNSTKGRISVGLICVTAS